VYLRAYESVAQARASIVSYLHFYNSRRPHSSLDRQTPDQAYFNRLPQIAAAWTRQAFHLSNRKICSNKPSQLFYKGLKPKQDIDIIMATYGYTRVSSSDQSTDTQIPKLKATGCRVVRTEKLSGKSRDGRDQLATLLEFIGPGDVLVCVKLDRLGRSTRDVLNLVHELDQKGAFLRILEPAISTDGPMGKMVLTVLGMVAEMELRFIKARQNWAGEIQGWRLQGTQTDDWSFGRPKFI
jgi:hypothetical protein